MKVSFKWDARFSGDMCVFLGRGGEYVLIYLRLQLSSMSRTSTSNPAGEVLAVAGLTSCILEAADDARKRDYQML